MKRLIVVALVLLFSGLPARAAGMTLAMFGDIFCIGQLSGDMAPVLAILTPDLRALLDKPGTDSAALPWKSRPDYAATCDFVGASGTRDTPEAVIAYGFRDPSKQGFADRLIFKLIDERLRLDDIAYGSGGTLRERLKGR